MHMRADYCFQQLARCVAYLGSFEWILRSLPCLSLDVSLDVYRAPEESRIGSETETSCCVSFTLIFQGRLPRQQAEPFLVSSLFLPELQRDAGDE